MSIRRRNSASDQASYGNKWRETYMRQMRSNESSLRGYDKDTIIFISMSQELKDEGNRCFQRRDYDGALINYEKAIQLLPENHVDISYIRSNMAECYMQMGVLKYPRAIDECNLALEVTPTYGKALLKRARCYEALNKLDLALRDVRLVLKIEPSNLMATELEQRLRKTFVRQGSRLMEVPVDLILLPEYAEPLASPQTREPMDIELHASSSMARKSSIVERKIDGMVEQGKRSFRSRIKGKLDLLKPDDKNTEDKLVVEEEKISSVSEEGSRRTMKLVYGEDIRWARVPVNGSILKMWEIISDHFPCLKAFLVKYKDQEGDLVTITTTEDLRWAEASAGVGSMKLHLFEVNPEYDPLLQKLKKDTHGVKQLNEVGNVEKQMEVCIESSTCLSDWIIHFAQFFKNYVGFDIDAHIDIHEVGTKLCSEAMEETVTSEEAQDLFSLAADKFQEMAALALFSWGNVHMSRARKRIHFSEDSAQESVLEKVQNAYDWAQEEFSNAGRRYEEALGIKSDFYEAVLALGQQQFEQAKLSWYFAAATGADLEQWPSGEVLFLYNNAEENIEKGMKMWEEREQLRRIEPLEPNPTESLLKKMKLDKMLKLVSEEEAEQQASNIRSQIYVLWGTMLYERSNMEFKLGLPVWQECLEAAIKKFELAGASPTDIGVMMKNHCSSGTGLEGLGFNIDEIIQAWNDMYEAKKLQNKLSSFRIEPLLRRRVSKLYHALEQK